MMIVLAVVGTVLIFVLAVVVGVVDAPRPRGGGRSPPSDAAPGSPVGTDDEYPTGPQPLSGAAALTAGPGDNDVTGRPIRSRPRGPPRP